MSASRRQSRPRPHRALIIANGALPPGRVVRGLARDADIIICADGGAGAALRLNVKPDIILGDFDSLSRSTARVFRRVPQIRIPAQDRTDLEKALEYSIALGCAAAAVVGALGPRIDHATGALGCFRKFGGKISIRLVDADGEIVPAGRRMKFTTAPGEKISLIPLDRCRGVATLGLRYALKGETLELGVREGISNEATGRSVSIAVAAGTLLVMRFRSPARLGRRARGSP